MVSQEGGVGSGHDHDAEHTQAAPRYYAGEWYTLGQFGKLKITIGYYIDSLTVVMFVMVCFISSCIHFYSMGYMHEELDEERRRLRKLTLDFRARDAALRGWRSSEEDSIDELRAMGYVGSLLGRGDLILGAEDCEQERKR